MSTAWELGAGHHDDIHLAAWADTGNGYTVQTQTVVRCLWCDYIAVGSTEADAVARYSREHEYPIAQRDQQRRQAALKDLA